MSVRKKTPAPVDEASPDDSALFRGAIGAVERIEHDLADRRRPAPPPRAHKTLADERAALLEAFSKPTAELELEMGEPLAYTAPGVSRTLLKQLGRGQYAIREEIDLHYMRQDEATLAIQQFLAEVQREDKLCVRIVHGKGMRSKGPGPVLKGLTDRILRQRADVIAFRSARAADGGSGAVVVLLRGTRKKRAPDSDRNDRETA